MQRGAGTSTLPDPLTSMGNERRIWLITNKASGSNGEQALADCEVSCAACNFPIAHRTSFPDQELPTPAMLDAAGIELVAIYAGDGTVNAALNALSGWNGEVLILPGGTKNLLFHRLFGDLTLQEALEEVATETAVALKPTIIECSAGRAYAGVLAGPGSDWADVREAMRNSDPIKMIGEFKNALTELLSGSRLTCEEPQLGRADGYPLIVLTPCPEALQVDAYHAESAADYLEHTYAVVRREFREGPHDRLGSAKAVTLTNTEGEDFGVLLDGEQHQAGPSMCFTLAECPVKLLASRTDG